MQGRRRGRRPRSTRTAAVTPTPPAPVAARRAGQRLRAGSSRAGPHRNRPAATCDRGSRGGVLRQPADRHRSPPRNGRGGPGSPSSARCVAPGGDAHLHVQAVVHGARDERSQRGPVTERRPGATYGRGRSARSSTTPPSQLRGAVREKHASSRPSPPGRCAREQTAALVSGSSSTRPAVPQRGQDSPAAWGARDAGSRLK